MPDLWPDDFGKASDVPPIAILKEQADLLAKKTKGEILGEITTVTAGANLSHHFMLVVPRMENYRYHLLTVTHSVGLYPAQIFWAVTGITHSTGTEGHFIQTLKAVLTADETKRVVASLLQQAESSSRPPPGAQMGVG